MSKFVKLSNTIDDEKMIPYFMWDYQLTNKEISEILKSSDEEKIIWLIAKIMRDGKFEDIWKLIDLETIFKYENDLKYRLGRRKNIWDFLLSKYKEYGIKK